MSHIDALWGFLVAAIVAFGTAPLAARLARKIGAIDMPKERGLHDEPTPSLGGLAILAGGAPAGPPFPPIFGHTDADAQTRGLLLGALTPARAGTAADTLHPP